MGALGKTVLLTTHYMEEAQALADRVVVIVAGEKVADGTPESIGGRSTAEVVVRFVLPTAVRAPICRSPRREEPRRRRRRSHRAPDVGPARADHVGVAIAAKSSKGSPSRDPRSKTSTCSSPATGTTIVRATVARSRPPDPLGAKDVLAQPAARPDSPFAFPLMFLVIFAAINGNETIHLAHGTAKFAQYFVPAIIAFGVISACYTNLAFTISVRRDRGVLKRVRGTPLSPFAYLAGIVGNAARLGGHPHGAHDHARPHRVRRDAAASLSRPGRDDRARRRSASVRAARPSRRSYRTKMRHRRS